MKKLFYFLLMLTWISGCKQKESAKELVEKNLIHAMEENLNSAAPAGTRFTVKDVVYYEEEKIYVCEFHVQMKSPDKDTAGVMTADVTRDFAKVFRKN